MLLRPGRKVSAGEGSKGAQGRSCRFWELQIKLDDFIAVARVGVCDIHFNTQHIAGVEFRS